MVSAIRVVSVSVLGACLLSACDSTTEVSRTAARLEIMGGNHQTGAPRAMLAQPLAVRLTDHRGRAVPGARVDWHLDGTSGSLASGVAFTDAAGVATVTRTLGQYAGPYLTVAFLQNVASDSARFEAWALVQGALRMELAPTDHGNSQLDTVLAVLSPHRVVLRDHTGAPVEHVDVTWTLLEGGGRLAAGFSRTAADGVAEMTYTNGPRAGEVVLAASVPGLLGSPITFRAQALPGNLVGGIRKLAGDSQVAVINSPLPTAYSVAVGDAHGNSLSANLQWSVVSGGGSIAPAASSALHRLGPQQGEQRVSASVTGRPDVPPATFTATAYGVEVQTFGDAWYGRWFAPQHITVVAGTTVGWLWTCGWYCYPEEHQIVFEDDPAGVYSSRVQLSGRHTRTFTTPATIRYRCAIHSTSFTEGMVGSVTVQ